MADPIALDELIKQRDKILTVQRNLHRTANTRRGQQAKNKPTRFDLQEFFTDVGALAAATSPPGQHINVKQSVVGYAYPPCTVPLAELKPMTIKELRLETNHRGKYLLVKSFGVPCRWQAVQNAVEDEAGSVDRLAVYNFDPSLTPTEVLPCGAVFAIKQPFYKMTTDGGVTIRVDHPSDLVRIAEDDARIPLALQPKLRELVENAAEQWKVIGNEAFRIKEYRVAVEAYSRGLKGCRTKGKDRVVKADLLRNRAIAYINLEQYEPALEDALKAVLKSDDNDGDYEKSKNNSKAFFRAGTAAYHLRNFQQAKVEFQKVIECAQHDGDAIRELVRTEHRLREQQSGTYNFDDMIMNVKRKQPRLDYADYARKVATRKSETGGNGLFATESINAGELVLCEKAFAVAFNNEETTELTVIINLNRDTVSMGTHATRLVSVIHKLRHNPKQAEMFSALYDGGYTPKSSTKLVDGVVPVDVFQVQAALELNGFGCTTTASVLEANEDTGAGVSTGVWITASFVNHDCIGNSQRSFIGDMMSIRATKDIAKDEEILMRYKNQTDDYDDFQKTLLQSWGFRCKCSLCVAESKTSGQQRKHRLGLVKKAREFLDANDLDGVKPPLKSLVTQAEKLWKRLDQSYDSAIFIRGLPRLGLHDLAHWLCMAHLLSRAGKSVIRDWATRCLAAQGIMTSIVAGKLIVNRELCRPDITGVHAATYMASTYEEAGIKEQFEQLGMELYQIGYGSMYGYNGTAQSQPRA
jgi:tetratricopeptide (TPR) repeat protein